MSANSFRAECESRALRYVEELLERGVTEEHLLKAVLIKEWKASNFQLKQETETKREKYMMSCHAQDPELGEVLSAAQYADVVEERNIEHLCGYPLCNEVIKSFSQQKYHVSMKNKQVYDLTERKKFCSETCYKCSEYVSAQLPSLPLWSRTETKPVKLTFLSSSKSTQGSTEDSVPQSSSSSPKKQTNNRSLHTTASPPSQSQRPTHNPPLLSKLPKVDSIKENPSPFKPAAQTPRVTIDLESNLKRASLESPRPPRPPQVSQVSKLLAAFSTWVSVPPHCSLSKSPTQDDRAEKDKEKQEEEDKEVEEGGEPEQHGSESLSVKDKEPSKDPSVFLPPVDSVNVGHVRYKVFMSQMKKHLSGVCSKLGLTLHAVLPRVTQTVSKFRFDRHCITFRPAEWRVIIVVLLMIHQKAKKYAMNSPTPEEDETCLQNSFQDCFYVWLRYCMEELVQYSIQLSNSCGKEDMQVVHSVVVHQWLQDIKATEQDLTLMLATFSSLD